MNDKLPQLIDWYNNLNQESLEKISDFYADDSYFKDPFNEFHNLKEVKQLYHKMFSKLNQPRFTVTNSFLKGHEAVLFWDFTFRAFGSDMKIQGNTFLKFDQNNKVIHHLDYWDTVNELWNKVPILKYFVKTFYKVL